jgi:hypothetical protein
MSRHSTVPYEALVLCPAHLPSVPRRRSSPGGRRELSFVLSNHSQPPSLAVLARATSSLLTLTGCERRHQELRAGLEVYEGELASHSSATVLSSRTSRHGCSAPPAHRVTATAASRPPPSLPSTNVSMETTRDRVLKGAIPRHSAPLPPAFQWKRPGIGH